MAPVGLDTRLLVFVLLVTSAIAADRWHPVATFSILGYDPATGETRGAANPILRLYDRIRSLLKPKLEVNGTLRPFVALSNFARLVGVEAGCARSSLRSARTPVESLTV